MNSQPHISYTTMSDQILLFVHIYVGPQTRKDDTNRFMHSLHCIENVSFWNKRIFVIIDRCVNRPNLNCFTYNVSHQIIFTSRNDTYLGVHSIMLQQRYYKLATTKLVMFMYLSSF